MKLSQTPPDVANLRREYVNDRWEQLAEIQTSYGEEAIKYLLVVNTAALGAALAFFGSMPHVRELAWPRLVLLLFAVAIVTLGIYHAFRFHRLDWMFSGWRRDSIAYRKDEMAWNDLVDRDENRVNRLNVIQGALAYVPLICFYSGLAIAAINFSDVVPKKGYEDDRTKAAIPPEAAATEPATTKPASVPDPQRRPRAQGRVGSSQDASPGPRSTTQ